MELYYSALKFQINGRKESVILVEDVIVYRAAGLLEYTKGVLTSGTYHCLKSRILYFL
jgi:hypothetical protein